MKELSHLLEYLLLKLILFPVRRVERRTAFRMADAVSDLVFHHPRIKGTAEENLRFVGFPEKLAKKSLKNFLRCSADFFRMDMYSEGFLKEIITYPDPEKVVPKGGGILLTAHVGNWEIMGALFSVLSGGKLSVVAKPLKNKRVNALVNSLREFWGIKVIPVRKGAEILRELVRGRYVGILLDQRVGSEEGILVPFLGRRAYTSRGPALFSLRTGKPVIPAFCFAEGEGYRIEVYDPIFPEGKTPEELTAEYTLAIEKAVRKYPDQWFWFHRRWKNSPDYREWKENEKGN